ncbi:MAG: SPOR domain-containing protein [Tannerella sp.]|uniref:HU domain-containing protein n=1 Tax=Tannerella sp. TaxID=2382127 RepID=UPI003FA1E7F5
MLRIITHIERVLLVNDCVIVPDFGGFVLRRRPALFTAEKNAFSPAHNEMAFNPSLNHDDGLLTESYMQMYGMDFSEAQQTLRQDLDEWKKILDDHGTVSCGRLGSFRRNEDGTLIFDPETAYYTIDAYGLTSFYMAPLEAERSHRKPVDFPVSPQDCRSKQTIRKEKAVRKAPLLLRMMGRIVGIAAAAVVLFFLITTPVKDVNRNSYTAGFAPSEILTSTFSAGEGQKEKASPVQSAKETNKPVALVPSHPEPSIGATAETVQKTTPASTEIAIEDVVNRSYYVIIGSFDSRSRARKFVSEVDPAECRQIGIVRSGQRIRVYAAKYDNRAEAEAYVNRLREKEKFKTSWVYIGHRES